MNLSNLSGADNAALQDIIRDRIRTAGPITFADFLSLVLYHPTHGYYFACDPKLDYESSPNVHPVFGAMIARQLADFWRLLGRPARFDVFEAGAGNGRLAGDVLRALRAEEPDLFDAVRYVVQDLAFSVRPEPAEEPARGEPKGRNAAAKEAFLERAGLPADKVALAADLPASPQVEGCILSNELLDALPFHRVRMRDGYLMEVRVDREGDRFVDLETQPRREVRDYFVALGLYPGEGCEAEVNLGALAWTGRAAAALRRGYILTIDYGYEAAEFYAPWRKGGTLLTFYRHTAGEDPYVRIGRQDITASVDFTSVIHAGESAGLRTLGLATQARFLAALGIGETLARQPAAGEIEAFYGLRRAVIELTDAWGLGRIKVLIQGRDVADETPMGLIPAS